MTRAMIEVSGLRKLYGSFEAVKDISFNVSQGEVVGFLGPNGAGKSTTLRILAGFLGASGGKVTVAGRDITEDPIGAREQLGYMPETSPLYPELRVNEYLHFRAELKRVARSKRKAAVAQALSDAGLDNMGEVLIAHLSKGFRQRVGLADALVASPPLLILDEPTAGLDPNQIREVRALIQRLSEKHTILVSTHILSEVEAMCSRGVVIARGELVAEGTIAELRALQKATALRVRLGSSDAQLAEKACQLLRELAGVASAEVLGTPGERGSWLTIQYADQERGDHVTAEIVARLAALEYPIVEVAPQSSLEEVFTELTRGKGQA